MQQQAQFTAEAFSKFEKLPENRERRFELVHGQIVEIDTTEERGLIMGNIGGELYRWNQQMRIGRVAISVHYQVRGDNSNVRMIDVSVSTARRPVVREGYTPDLPDLAVHIKTVDQPLLELREKARYYLANGSKMVWLVIPTKRIIEVYANDFEDSLTENDVLDGRDMLPGFTLPVRDVFADPADEQDNQTE